MTPRSASGRMLVVVAALGAMIGCGGRQFLGAPLPASCSRSEVDCGAELLQRAWRDTVGADDRGNSRTASKARALTSSL